MEVGTDTPLFKIPHIKCTIICAYTWIKNLWELLWTHRIILEIKELIRLSLIRYRDIHML